MRLVNRSIVLFLIILSSGLNSRSQISLPVQDTRSVITTPSSYSSSFEAHFKYGSVLGFPNNSYYTILGLRGWSSDNSGDKAHELAFDGDGQILFRSGFSPTWEAWRKLIIADPMGNVGIGTAVPTTPLYVNGGPTMTSGWNKTATLAATYPVLTFNSNNTKWAGIGYDYSGYLNFWVNGSSDDISGTGIGALSINQLGQISISQSLNLVTDGQEMKFHKNGNVYGYLWSSSAGLHWGKGTAANSITVDNNGNAGIGTFDTKGYKLAVNGNIRSKEIKVEATNWPDYVFAKDYQLPTLKETEKHIKDKGHLPGIPSAEEVKANGIDLGEMNAKLLQKIEELTLHIISQDKRIQDLEKSMKK